MALEDLIRLHTEALIQNTEAMNLLTQSLAGRTASAATKAADAAAAKTETKPKAEAKKEEPKADPKPEVKDETGDDEPAALDFGTVRALVLKLAPNNRDAIQALNKKHGIAKLSALLADEKDFASVTDQAKLEAVYADLQDLDV